MKPFQNGLYSHTVGDINWKLFNCVQYHLSLVTGKQLRCFIVIKNYMLVEAPCDGTPWQLYHLHGINPVQKTQYSNETAWHTSINPLKGRGVNWLHFAIQL